MVCDPIIPFLERTFSVDSMCVSLSDLKDFAEGSAADELENVSKSREVLEMESVRRLFGTVVGGQRSTVTVLVKSHATVIDRQVTAKMTMTFPTF